MGPKQKSQIQVPKSFWSRAISKCSSHSKFYPTSLQIHSTQTTQGEAIGADPGMDLPLEAFILTGPKQAWGSEPFLKIVQVGPIPNRIKCWLQEEMVLSELLFLSYPWSEPRPSFLSTGTTQGEAEAKGTHQPSNTATHLPLIAWESPRLLKELSCGVLGVVFPGNMSQASLQEGSGTSQRNRLAPLPRDVFVPPGPWWLIPKGTKWPESLDLFTRSTYIYIYLYIYVYTHHYIHI